MLSFANDSFRKAASVVFDASASTLSIGNRNFISEILEALEDVGTSPSASASVPSNDHKISQNVAIPTNDVIVNGDQSAESIPMPMSVSTTLGSSIDSDASDVSNHADADVAVGPTTEEEEEENDDNNNVDKATSLPIICMDEVGDHYTPNDAWMVVYDKVYNFTDFMMEVRSTIHIQR